MNYVVPSIAHTDIRFRLSWNDDSFRTPCAVPNASYFRTLGDGECQHTPTMSVATAAMAVDLILSCHAALKVAIANRDTGLIDAIRSALSVRFAMSCDTAAKALKVALSGKPGYIVNGEVVTGAKYANRRDAEPLPRISADADQSVQSFYRHTLICGKYPSILEMIMGAVEADRHSFGYSLKSLGEQNAIAYLGDGSLKEATYYATEAVEVAQAYERCRRFAVVHVAEAVGR